MKKKFKLLPLIALIISGCASNQPPENLSYKQKQCWIKAKNWFDYQVATQIPSQDYSVQTTPSGMINQGVNNIQSATKSSSIRKYLNQQANAMYTRCASY